MMVRVIVTVTPVLSFVNTTVGLEHDHPDLKDNYVRGVVILGNT